MGVISNGTTLLDAGAIDSGIATGAMTHIKTLTASGSGTLSFVHGASSVVLDGTYKEYIFKFYNIHPSASSKLTFNVSIDSGSNYNVVKTSTFFRTFHYENGTGGAGIDYDGSVDIAQGAGFQSLGESVMDTASDGNICGQINLFDPANTTFVKNFTSSFNYNSSAQDGLQFNGYVGGYANTTSAVNGLQFKMASGNMDSGTIKLYGIK